MQNESQRHNDKGRAKTSLENMYLSLYCKGSKRVTQGFMVRGSWRPNITAIYIVPHSYGRQRCVVLVLQGCSTGGPGAQLSAGWWLSLLHLITNWSPKLHWGSRGPLRPGFLYHILSATSLDPNSIGGLEGPLGLVWLSLPHLVSYSNWSLTVLTELYNSSTPTQSLEGHVWSSSSGNNSHAIQRSLSSGVSVYECTMGFFILSHFISQARLRDFLS